MVAATLQIPVPGFSISVYQMLACGYVNGKAGAGAWAAVWATA
jgi:hypothetical protein